VIVFSIHDVKNQYKHFHYIDYTRK